MKLKLPLSLLAALFVCINAVVYAATEGSASGTNPPLEDIPVASGRVTATQDTNYAVEIEGDYDISWHIAAKDVTWDQSYDYPTWNPINIGSALTESKFSVITPEGAAENTVVSTGANLFIGCSGWGVTTSDINRPRTGEVYVGKDATLIVGKGMGDDSSATQLNIGAGGSYSKYGHEGIMVVDGGTVKAGCFNVANGYGDIKGTLMVKNGGTAIADSQGAGYHTGVLTLGYYGGGSGTAIVESGSTITAEYYTMVAYGRGNDKTGESLGPAYGTLEVKGKSTANLGSFLFVGRENGSVGSVTVDDSTLMATSTYLGYSGDGASGSVLARNGAIVRLGTTYLGYADGTSGDITVSSGAVLSAGNVYVGVGGTGALTVRKGASVDIAEVYIGYDGDASGTVTVDGTGSKLTVEGDMYVGVWGTGALTVRKGASVDFAGVYIGYSGGASGTVTVDGAGSHADIGWGCIGYSGEGKLNITNGASVDIAGVYIGYKGGASGTVTVDGAASSLNVTGFAVVGADGSGTMDILNGGTATFDNDLLIGNAAEGTVTVGKGASLKVDGGLQVGYNGIGQLTVADGGVLDVSGDIGVGFLSSLTKSNLTLKDGQTLYLNSSAKVKGSVTAVAGSIVELEGSSTITGTLALNGATLVLDGCTQVLDHTTTLASVGSLSAGSGSQLVLEGIDLGSLKADTYTLMRYTGSVGNLNALALSGKPTAGFMTYTVQADGGLLKLVVKGDASTLLWDAANGTTWGVGSADQWFAPDGSTLVDYANGKNVVFEGGSAKVDGVVRPGSILVQGPSKSTTILSADEDGGTIAGSASLIKNGESTLTIQMANTYTGGTTVNGGTLKVDFEGALGSGPITVNGGTLEGEAITLKQDLTLTGGEVKNDLCGTGGVVKTGEGTATLSGTNSYSGHTDVQAGTLELVGSLVGSTASVGEMGTLNAYADVTLGSLLTVDGSLYVESSANVAAGSLAMGKDAYAGVTKDGTLTAKSLTMDEGAMLDYASPLGVESATVNGSASITGGLTVTAASDGTGALNVKEGATLTSGSIVLGSGTTLDIGKGASIELAYGETPSLTIADGATINVTADWSLLTNESSFLYIVTGTVSNNGTDNLKLADAGLSAFRDTACLRIIDEADGTAGLVVDPGSKQLLWATGKDYEWNNDKDDMWKDYETPAVKENDSFYTHDQVVFSWKKVNPGIEQTETEQVVVTDQVNAQSVTIEDGDFRFTGKGSLGGVASIVIKEDATLTMAVGGVNSQTGNITVNGGKLIIEGAANAGDLLSQTEVKDGGSIIITDEAGVDTAAPVIYKNTLVIEGQKNELPGNLVPMDLRINDDSSVIVTGNEALSLVEGATLTVGEVQPVTAMLMSKGMPAGGKARSATPPVEDMVGDYTFAGGTATLRRTFNVAGGVSFTGEKTLTFNLTEWWKPEPLTEGNLDGTILVTTTQGVSGAENLFSGVSIDLPEELDAWEDLVYLKVEDGTATEGTNPQDVVLTLGTPEAKDGIANQLSLNERRVYNALCDIAASDPERSELSRLASRVAIAPETEAAYVKELLDSVNVEGYATMMSSQIEGNLSHLRRLRGHMGHGHLLEGSKSGLAAYVNGYSELADVDADATGPGYRRSEWGAEVGVEQEIGEGCGIGLALSAGRANVTPTGGVRYHEDSWNLDAYHIIREGAWENRVSIGVGFHEHDLARRGMGGVRATAGNVGGRSFNFMEEIAYYMPVTETMTLRPFFAVESSVNDIDGFAEAGDSLALRGESQNAWATDLTLGVGAETSFAVLSNAPRATFGLHAGVTASVGDTTSDLRMSFAGAPGHSFSQSSADRSRWGMNLGAGVNVPVSRYTSLYATADSVFRSDSVSFDAQLGVHINF